MDNELWERMVSSRNQVHILGSAPSTLGGINAEAGTARMLNQARRIYQTVCVDLPGEMRDYELETLNGATECFLVSTPDLSALYLARRKCEGLRALGFRTRITTVVNKYQPRASMSIRDIEGILQLPVAFTVPAAEKQIAEAVVLGKVLDRKSEIVTAMERIARQMLPVSPQQTPSKVRRFLDTFSISPVRERFPWPD
jgi:Flp pilus assembly CpaE family ATPase